MPVIETRSTPKLTDWAQRTWVHVVGWIVYAGGFLLLKLQTNFPEEFGLHKTSYGRAGGYELFWYSRLLVTRANFWNLALFVWMLGGMAIGILFSLFLPIKRRRARAKSLEHSSASDQAVG